jgi:hypothetical protein
MSVEEADQEIAEEVLAPLTPDHAPLRCVLLHQETQCIFILSSHHTVCDGSSRIVLLRDILLVLIRHVLKPLPSYREILFGAQQRTSTESGLPSFTAQIRGDDKVGFVFAPNAALCSKITGWLRHSDRAFLFVRPTTQFMARNRAIMALIWSGTSIGEKCPDPSVRAITSCGVRLWNRCRSRRGIAENM